MHAKSYAFSIGDIACNVVLDGASLLGRERILKRYPDATEAEYRKAYADIGLSLDEADTSFNILVAQIGGETVLVDSGEGGKPYGGHLLDSLQRAGIAPEAITLVVLTHSHGDHVLGLLSDSGAPVFPNARYVLSSVELAFWQQRIAGGLAEQQPILDMMQAQGLRLIDMAEAILPGLTAVPLPGHTPGQIGLLLESAGERLLHLADALHTPMQFAHPEWSPTFDADTSVSVPTRRAALQRAASENLLTLFYHLTFPGLGRVKDTPAGFRWQPLTVPPVPADTL